MAATATQQVIANGPRNLVLKYNLDGITGDASAATLVDISDIDSSIGSGLRLDKATWSLTGLSCKLSWEGASDVDLIEMADGDGCFDFIGGVKNNASIPTGNVLFTTTGYTGSGDGGHFVLEFVKKAPVTVTAQDPEPSVGSLTFTGAGPALALSIAFPSVGSLSLTGAAPTVA